MKVLVWLPLPDDSNWVGEGIAQTLERWLEVAHDDVSFTLFVNAKAKDHLQKVFKGKSNLNLVGNEIFFGSQVDDDFEKIEYTKSYKNKILPYVVFNKAFSFLKSVAYVLKIYLATWLYNKRFIFSDCDLVWVPSPSVPFVERLTVPVAYSFWDPFVFEYDEFKLGPREAYLNKLRVMLWQGRRNAHVLTQSDANRRFLSDIMNVPEKNISYVRLGCPDYMALVSDNFCAISAYKKSRSRNILDLWIDELERELLEINGVRRAKKVNKFIEDAAIFFRYANNIEENSRLILVSTQNRPYKGLSTLLESLAALKKISKYKLHFAFTCSLSGDDKRRHPELYESLLEFSRLSNKMHAILTACSDLVLHPSYVEGGLGSYSMYESASVNVPSLTNKGRHTSELVS